MDQSTTENTGPVAAASLSSNKPDDTAEVDREDLARFQATPEGNRRAVIASLFFLVVALFVGVPVWLKTTATYQAPLPFWDIKALCSRSIKVAVPLTLVSFTDQLNKVDLSTVGSDLATSEDITLRCGTSSQSKLSKKLHVRCAVQTRSATPDEQATVKSALSHATSLNEFLSRVEALLPSDETESRDCNQSGCDPSEIASSVYTISILPPGVHALLKGVVSVSNSPLESAIPVSIVRDQTNRNVIYIVLPKEQSLNRVQLTAYIAKLMNSVMLTVDDLQDYDVYSSGCRDSDLV
ncbi:unnamed protein product [Echinostoma caproni]|uniref:Transmembrane protein n=1 Tax=Echinostoma caproni TaxID=27848 RepID=A0A183AY18_9TREM|nr:unnamed protein product [Echinostoma caproni]